MTSSTSDSPAPKPKDEIDVGRMIKVVVILSLAMGLAIVLCMWLMPQPESADRTVFPRGMAPLGTWHYVVIHDSAGADLGPAALETFRCGLAPAAGPAGCHFVIGGDSARGEAALADGDVRCGTLWMAQRPGLDCVVVRSDSAEGGAEPGRDETRYGIGIVLVGDFQAAPPTEAQMDALVRTLYDLTRGCRIPLTHVVTHGELAGGRCPGACFPMPDLLRRLGERHRR